MYAVPVLEAAMEAFAERSGVRPAFGGRHTGRGTHNALVDLGEDAYLEIIAPDPGQPAPPEPRPFGIDRVTAARLVTWAMKAPDIDSRVARARAAGYDPGPVLAMGRERPDGTRLTWRLARSAEPRGEGLVPFPIDWGATPHPSATAPRGCRLVGLRGEHPRPAEVEPLLRAVGVELPLSSGPEPRLIATIDTPRGRLELG